MLLSMMLLGIMLVGCKNEKVSIDFRIGETSSIVQVKKGSIISKDIIPLENKIGKIRLYYDKKFENEYWQEPIEADSIIYIEVKEKMNCEEINDINVEYNLNAFDYFDNENKFDVNIFHNNIEMKNYFNGDRFAFNESIYHYIDKLDCFKEYNIIHFASCFGTSDTLELTTEITNNNIILNFKIITHTTLEGYAEEGLIIKSYFFLIENEILEKYEKYECVVSYSIIANIK